MIVRVRLRKNGVPDLFAATLVGRSLVAGTPIRGGFARPALDAVLDICDGTQPEDIKRSFRRTAWHVQNVQVLGDTAGRRLWGRLEARRSDPPSDTTKDYD